MHEERNTPELQRELRVGDGEDVEARPLEEVGREEEERGGLSSKEEGEEAEREVAAEKRRAKCFERVDDPEEELEKGVASWRQGGEPSAQTSECCHDCGERQACSRREREKVRKVEGGRERRRPGGRGEELDDDGLQLHGACCWAPSAVGNDETSGEYP